MSLLDSLYQDLILEHYRRPRNRGRLEPNTLSQEGLNPSCGDELELFLRVEDGVVGAIGFVGQGCAISQATASMMTEALKGRTLEDAALLADDFRDMVQGEEPSERLGDLRALKGVSKLHARVKCATLPWTTLQTALARLSEQGG